MLSMPDAASFPYRCFLVVSLASFKRTGTTTGATPMAQPSERSARGGLQDRRLRPDHKEEIGAVPIPKSPRTRNFLDRLNFLATF